MVHDIAKADDLDATTNVLGEILIRLVIKLSSDDGRAKKWISINNTQTAIIMKRNRQDT